MESPFTFQPETERLFAMLPYALAGRYLEPAVLGRGSQGTVWRAFDRLRDRRVVLKVGEGAWREGEALSALAGSGVVLLIDAGESHLTTELVDGPRLDRWLLDDPPVAEVALVLDRLLEALDEIHGQGYVHGDVKPQNIVLWASKRPVLVDFGLAAPIGTPARGGTPAYRPPGLSASAPLTPADERWAVGKCFARWLDDLQLGSRLAALMDRTTTPVRRRPRHRLLGALHQHVSALQLHSPVGVPPGDAALIGPLIARRRRIATVLEGGDDPLGEWRRLALCAHSRREEPPRPQTPDSFREYVEAFAAWVVDCLRDQALGGVLAVTPERWPAPSRAVLARVQEAAAVDVVVLQEQALDTAQLRPLPADLLEASNGAEWFGRQAVNWTDALAFLDALDPHERGVGHVQEAWVKRLSGLPAAELRALDALAWVSPIEEEEAAEGSLLVGVERLVTLGLARWDAHRRLVAVPDVPLTLERFSESDVTRLEAHLTLKTSPRLARLLELSGRAREAARARRADAERAEARFDLEEAARLYTLALETSADWWLASAADDGPHGGAASEDELTATQRSSSGDAGRLDVNSLERAIRCAEAVGDRALLGRLAAVVPPGTGTLAKLATARLAAAAGRHREVLELLEPATAMRGVREGDAAGAEPPATKRQQLEASLLLGTAASYAGDTALAVRALTAAEAIAEALEDAHALGRVANNLGNVWLVQGRGDEAQAAYDRSAAAKRLTRDRRGERVALSNGAIAARERLAFREAGRRASQAGAIAASLGEPRGRVAAALVEALVALDLGDAQRAESALAPVHDLPVTSEVARLDRRLTVARLWLARGAAHADSAGEARHESSSPFAQLAGDALAQEFVEIQGAADRAGAHEAAFEAAWLRLVAGGPVEPALPAAPSPAAAPLARVAERVVAARRGDLSGLPEAVEALVASLPAVLPAGASPLVALLEELAELADHPRALDAVARLVDATRRQRQSEAHPNPCLDRFLLTGSLPQGGDIHPMLVAAPTNASLLVRAPRPPAAPELLAGLVAGTGANAGWWWSDLAAAPSPAARTGLGNEPRAQRVATYLGRSASYEAELPGGRRLIGLTLAPGAVVLEGLCRPPEPSLLIQLSLLARAERAESEATAATRQLAAERAARVDESGRHRDELTALREVLEQSRTDMGLAHGYDRIVHQSRPMRQVLRTLDNVAPSDVSILVTGESGVGKELVARALHEHSPRHAGPFVAENCGAIPSELFESVFFGHAKGAFTGAVQAQRGLVEAARGGTLFLDEVGELRLDLQAKLLRVLQERRFRPVGAPREVEADFRLVAATNRDLMAEVAAGRFREDLYYRLAVVVVPIPPLRERLEDLPALTERLLAAHATPARPAPRLSDAALELLLRHAWPGNVRELENELVRAGLLARDVIEPRHLSENLRAGSRPERRTASPAPWDGAESLADALERTERAVLVAALAQHGGRKSRVAAALGLSRPGLDAKLNRLGLEDQARTRGRR